MTGGGAALRRWNGLALAAALLWPAQAGLARTAPGPTGPARAAAARPFTDCRSGCPAMVVVPAGTFRMGGVAGEEGRPEYPVHSVTIARPFAVGQREISNAEFARFVAETGHAPSKGCRSLNPQTGTVDMNPAADFRAPGPGAGNGQPNLPAVCISWTDAMAYAAWLARKTGKAYRLLSEAEWEYAARAGSTADYPWGDAAGDGCAFANVYDLDGAARGVTAVFQEKPAAAGTAAGSGTSAPAGPPALPSAACHDGFAGAAPVGSFKANAFGLQDMIGNVWEWTEDCYVAPYPADVPVDGRPLVVSGACPRRVVRGGSWITVPFRNRPAWRGRDPETLVSWIFGFRVARDLTPADRAAAAAGRP